eukprot:4262657-Amphidinium_carterae.1
MEQYEGCAALGRRGPGGPQPKQQPVTPGSKRWSAQQRAGWDCPRCKFYNLVFRTTCFACKAGQRPAGQQPPQGSGKPQIPSSLSKPWEPWAQLEFQLASEKDPEVKALLQQAANLKKKQAASFVKELPLQDQRSKLTAQVKRLTASLDKQQELLAAQQLKVKELRRELAEAHVDLARLPEEVLPAPKKIPRALLEPSLVSMMKYVQEKASGGDLMASTLLEECVAGLEQSKDEVNPPPPLEPAGQAAPDAAVAASGKRRKTF